jgi:pectin methylesterase-like acyl-CoA thioesterase
MSARGTNAAGNGVLETPRRSPIKRAATVPTKGAEAVATPRRVFAVDDHPDAPQTIHAALQSAQRGDIISVAPGRYLESLVIDKAVTLVGKGTVELVAASGSDQPLLLVTQDDIAVKIENISFVQEMVTEAPLETKTAAGAGAGESAAAISDTARGDTVAEGSGTAAEGSDSKGKGLSKIAAKASPGAGLSWVVAEGRQREAARWFVEVTAGRATFLNCHFRG